MKNFKKIIFLCCTLMSFTAFAQTGPNITINNTLVNCQIEVTLFQINTTTLDCSPTALVTMSFGLGVTSSQTVSPIPGYAFIKAYVQKGGGTVSCFNALIEPNDSPCDVGSIDEGQYFPQCCSSSMGGGTHAIWSGGIMAPTINIGNS